MSDMNDRDLSLFAEELARRDRPSAPPALRARLRASLLAAPVAPARRAPFALFALPSLRLALAAVIILAVMAMASGSAAASSLPGDPAFALKRAGEEIEAFVASDDATRLDTRVAQSDRRLADLETATLHRPSALAPATTEYIAASERVSAALATVLAQPRTAARDAAIARASAASADHIAALQALAARLPAAAQFGIQRAIEVQQTVHEKTGSAPGRPLSPGPTAAPGPSAVPGRPSELPGRGGVPSALPGRP